MSADRQQARERARRAKELVTFAHNEAAEKWILLEQLADEVVALPAELDAAERRRDEAIQTAARAMEAKWQAEGREREMQEALEPTGLARRFHETYERLAPEYGYETRRESAVPWEDVPEPNRSLMIAVATEIVASLRASEGQ